MLELKNVNKEYGTGASKVEALQNVSLGFRSSEFVAILGPSGCGKTTLLNIVGGLDNYTSGDLLINGVSTKKYKAADWDAYRNHSIGFVFQSYNLISHQSVLANVELALKLSGVSAKEQKRRAIDALEKVGLKDQIHKLPAQMSGGQMQRVAIARALVNNPSIILADEPTGALDSKTSIQIMELLKEVAKNRLVIMVTHNPELAEKYATRIVKLKDGRVESDSKKPTPAQLKVRKKVAKPKHTSLSFKAALALSANNLRTKKGRTFLTSFAGAIGIIGIALIMSLSSGMNAYIQNLETQTMGAYPITLQKTTLVPQMEEAEGVGQDTSEVGASQEFAKENMAGSGFSVKKDSEKTQDPGAFTSTSVVGETFSMLRRALVRNNLASFKSYLGSHESDLSPWVSGVEYTYDVDPQVFREDASAASGVRKVNPVSLLSDSSYLGIGSSFIQGIQTKWDQLVSTPNLRENQYDLCAGQWPQEADEVALVLNENYKISDFNLYQLGLMDASKMDEIIEAAKNGDAYTEETQTFSYDAALGRTFDVFSPAQFYQKTTTTLQDGTQKEIYVSRESDLNFVHDQMNAGTAKKVKIVGVLHAKDAAPLSEGGIVYTKNLTMDLMAKSAAADVTKAQLADAETNVLTGEKFSDTNDITSDFNEGYGQMLSSMMGAAASADSGKMEQLGLAPGGGLASDADAGAEAGAAATLHLASERKNATYAVTFNNWDGSTLLGPTTYQEGSAITDVPADPTRPADDNFSYLFFGWMDLSTKAMYFSTTLPAVSKDTVYQAMFIPVPMPDPEIQALIKALQNMSPSQRELLMQIAQGKTPDLSALIAAGFISPDGLSSFMGQYLMSPEGQALLKQYLPQMANMDGEAFMRQYLASLTPAQLQALFSTMGGADLSSLFAGLSDTTPKTYDNVLKTLGYATEDNPSSIVIYPKDFDGKKQVEAFLQTYNDEMPKDDHVTYTDLVGTMTKGISDIIDIISAVLIAFVSIALVVSSIMIAIITWISVLERTKEIGILRALGASKRDVSKIFNAETFIEGLLAGILGILITVLLDIPISMVIYAHYGAENIASLPLINALVLIGISVLLTLVAGFVPARLAAKKDPVEALRSE